MKNILFVFSVLFSLLPFAVSADQFIEGFEDIPLMQGLKQQENRNFSFGNEESGYTEAVLFAVGYKTFNQVQQFYTDILPKFGWTLRDKTDKALFFTRENDVLEISLQKAKPLQVLVNVKSKN